MNWKEQLNVRHHWFNPIWRRIGIVFFAFSWTGFELLNGNTGWAAIFGVASIYLAHQFLWDWVPVETEADKGGKE